MSKLARWIFAGIAALSAGSASGATLPPLLTDRSSFGELLASLSSASPSDLSKVEATSKVTFVHVADMPGYPKDGLRFSPAARKSMVGNEAAVYLSPPLLGHLIDAGYSTTDVVALSVDARGEATIFIAK